jgi:hypothetical protein
MIDVNSIKEKITDGLSNVFSKEPKHMKPRDCPKGTSIVYAGKDNVSFRIQVKHDYLGVVALLIAILVFPFLYLIAGGVSSSEGDYGVVTTNFVGTMFWFVILGALPAYGLYRLAFPKIFIKANKETVMCP